MPLNEDVESWFGLPVNAVMFEAKGITAEQYLVLLEQASGRAKQYILNSLYITQAQLDASGDGDNLNIGFQLLSCYELLKIQTAGIANVLPFSRYTNPEGESVSQDDKSFSRYWNSPLLLKTQALNFLHGYIPNEYKEQGLEALTFNWK